MHSWTMIFLEPLKMMMTMLNQQLQLILNNLLKLRLQLQQKPTMLKEKITRKINGKMITKAKREVTEVEEEKEVEEEAEVAKEEEEENPKILTMKASRLSLMNQQIEEIEVAEEEVAEEEVAEVEEDLILPMEMKNKSEPEEEDHKAQESMHRELITKNEKFNNEIMIIKLIL